MSEIEYIIQMQNVNKWYGDFHVLKDINLNVKKGEKVVICGPSGSGKSTTIRCMNHLEKFQEGKILIRGQELIDDVTVVREIRSHIGMVFQHFNLFPHLSILENLILAPTWVYKKPRREAIDIAMHYLERVKIADQAHKFPNQLSGGQQQRLCIARALAAQPDIILMDEPCSALDPIATAKVEELIEELRSSYTIIIVTHSMQQAARISQKTAFFHLGEIVEVGDTDQLFTSPSDSRTQGYITGRFG